MHVEIIYTKGFYINRVQAVFSNIPSLIFLSTTPVILGNQVGEKYLGISCFKVFTYLFNFSFV